MPTEWEQDTVKAYVSDRQLVRPDTNIGTALISVLLFVSVTGLFAWWLNSALMSVGVLPYLPLPVRNFYGTHPHLSIVIHGAIVTVIGLLLCAKRAAIGMIRLYQHYAPEEIRRRCLFMPTCSEYAILAIRKYGCVIGLCKSYYRLMYRCRGNVYMIDYP